MNWIELWAMLKVVGMIASFILLIVFFVIVFIISKKTDD